MGMLRARWPCLSDQLTGQPTPTTVVADELTAVLGDVQIDVGSQVHLGTPRLVADDDLRPPAHLVRSGATEGRAGRPDGVQPNGGAGVW